MEYKKEGGVYIIRLDKGDEIISSLNRILKEEKIKSGWFCGIGALSKVKLVYFCQSKKDFKELEVNEEVELTSLNGDISMMDGEPYIHAHGTISDSKFNVKGGHFKEGVVGATVEIVLLAFEVDVNRKFNSTIGLNLFDF